MLDIPVAVDVRRLDRNIGRFHQQVAAAGRVTRAHLKAHRTIELTARQVAGGAIGAAVHTVRAARELAAAGVADVVVAWPWREPWRWPLYVGAAHEIERFAVHVDAADTVTGLGRLAAAEAAEVGVRIDVRHTPVDEVLPLARLIRSTAGVRLDGVTGYRGTETMADVDGREKFGQHHAEQLVAIADSIRAEGIDCPVVSAGGTPTALGALRVDGITEIVAGAYATLDGGLAVAGACDLGDVAISVATERAELLAECGQPWDPEVVSVPADGRLLPAHVCPLARNLMRSQTAITVLHDGVPVDQWLPRGRPDHG